MAGLRSDESAQTLDNSDYHRFDVGTPAVDEGDRTYVDDRARDDDRTNVVGDSAWAHQPLGALRWLAWLVGLTILWYVLGFGTHLVREMVPDGPEGRLPLPLYPSGYGRLVVGALIASTVLGVVGRRASRVFPAGFLAAGLAWALTREGLFATTEADFYADDRIILLGTAFLGLSTLIGLSLGVWGASGAWQRLAALSVVAALAGSFLLGSYLDLRSTFDADSAIGETGLLIGDWLTLAALFGLAMAIAAMGRAYWLVLTLISSVVLPVGMTVLVDVTALMRPRSESSVVGEVLSSIFELVPAVLATADTWFPPLAVFVGGVLGLAIRLSRRGRVVARKEASETESGRVRQ